MKYAVRSLYRTRSTFEWSNSSYTRTEYCMPEAAVKEYYGQTNGPIGEYYYYRRTEYEYLDLHAACRRPAAAYGVYGRPIDRGIRRSCFKD